MSGDGFPCIQKPTVDGSGMFERDCKYVTLHVELVCSECTIRTERTNRLSVRREAVGQLVLGFGQMPGHRVFLESNNPNRRASHVREPDLQARPQRR